MSKVISNASFNDVTDIDLSVTKRRKFRIDKDDNRILELNVSDMNIIKRISDTYPKLQILQEKATKLLDGIEEDDVSQDDVKTIGERLAEVDTEMRKLIDYLFDANVSEIAAPDGSMYDPFNGSLRYEYIITTFMNQYEDNLKSEFSKMTKQLNKHTAKYTNTKG